MSLPLSPPKVQFDAKTIAKVVAHINRRALDPYWHWDELRHRAAPEGLSHEDWWTAVKVARGASYRAMPLRDREGRRFVFTLTDQIHEALHRIDMSMGSPLHQRGATASANERDRYVVATLIEESITSSQIEGASTTRRVAAEMLRSGRPPGNKSERMIANNYAAMRFIREQRDLELTPEAVLELHRILTRGTLEDERDEGRLQAPGEDRVVVRDNRDGTILHTPPAAKELPARLQAMCEFANGKTPAGEYLHPVVRAIVLHFWLAYDHPFQDGNGRTARALFYWGMLHEQYVLAEFISISKQIKLSQGQYRKAFLHTETDENDLTYFVLNQLKVLLKSIDELGAYLKRKGDEIRQVESRLKSTDGLNHRQKALLAHAIRNPGFSYSIESHRRSHDVAYATARADLLNLAELKLLNQSRSGKEFRFESPADLETRLTRK